MNKKIQQWLVKPAWQLFFWQWSLVGLLACCAYLLELRPINRQRTSADDELTIQQNHIEQIQQKLALLPELSFIERQINELSPQGQLQLTSQKTVIQHVSTSIAALGGSIIRWKWQPSQTVDNPIPPHWDATIDIDFQGLTHFLHDILKIQPSISIEQMHIIPKGNRLNVKLAIAEFISGDKDE